jgi:T4 RnlA family RNA ligase
MDILERAMKIVENNEAFYYKDEIVDGTPFRIFNYRLASYLDFSKDTFALELRGLTVNLETGEYFWGLHKFFNDNENPFTMGDELWEDEELLCMEKLDGSLIQCIVKDGRVYAKTKGTFFSEQAQMAQKIINENINYQMAIRECYKTGLFLYFELVSPFNQVVVPYEKTELRLIQARRIITGEYLDYNDLKNISSVYNLPIVEVYKLSNIKKLTKNISEKQLRGILGNKKFKKNKGFFEFLERKLNEKEFIKNL